MKSILYVLLAGCCLLLMGCPLQTDSPIKGDAVSMPSWLPGRWTEVKQNGQSGTTYQIKADPAGHGKLVVKTMDDNGNPDDKSVRAAVISTVKGQLFISVYDKGDDATSEPGYYHYALDHSSTGDMELVPLKEHIVSSTAGGDELAAYIAGHPGADDYLDTKATERYRKQ